MTDFLKLSREAFDSSSAFVDANYRSDWDYGIKAFRSEHAAGSKYLSPEYAHRSRLYRPKTRSIIRKNEAAGAMALFSSMEIVDVQPANPDDPMAVASRDAIKAVLEYRLTNTIPWFEICMGGIQDAQVTGAVVSYQYWDYQQKDGVVVKDKPCIELRPVENIRLDGGASWLDPVGTSPYFCDIIPMPVCQVRGMMKSKDSKTNQPRWKSYVDSVILQATPDEIDSTRKARLGKQQDPHRDQKVVSDFTTVWVMRWFMKDSQNDDFTYYTLGTDKLLTDPSPLHEVYFHGVRPYEMGYAVLETHKVFKPGMPILVKQLQQEKNEIGNQRIDNVKFALNKRWLVARGRQVDVQSLVRNVPGGVTLLTDPKTDVVESNWPDVTSSAYVEDDRINAEFDDLAGNFSPNTKFANKGTNDTLGGARLASQGAGLVTDYLLRTVIETWVEKVMKHMVKLEAAYETDEKVLAICAKKARLFPRYGISQISDQMLNDDVTLTINVGMGATDPNTRFQKAMMFFGAANQLIMTAPPGANVQEQIKELGGHAGFRDATRFYGGGEDPRLLKAMQMLQQMQGMLNGKMLEMKSRERIENNKLISNERVKAAELHVDAGRIHGDLRIRETETAIEAARVQLERYIADMEQKGVAQEHLMMLHEFAQTLREGEMRLQEQRLKNHGQVIKMVGDLQKQRMQLEDKEAA